MRAFAAYMLGTSAMLSMACHRQQSIQQVAPSDSVNTSVEVTVEPLRLEPGDLLPGEARALGSRFTDIRVEPDSIVLGVGANADLRRIKVFAVDSSGTVLGRLRTYDHGMRPGAAEISGFMQVRGVAPGRSEFTITVSTGDWGNPDRARPEVVVPIIVGNR